MVVGTVSVFRRVYAQQVGSEGRVVVDDGGNGLEHTAAEAGADVVAQATQEVLEAQLRRLRLRCDGRRCDGMQCAVPCNAC